jgi:hypothetical protein
MAISGKSRSIHVEIRFGTALPRLRHPTDHSLALWDSMPIIGRKLLGEPLSVRAFRPPQGRTALTVGQADHGYMVPERNGHVRLESLTYKPDWLSPLNMVSSPIELPMSFPVEDTPWIPN